MRAALASTGLIATLMVGGLAGTVGVIAAEAGKAPLPLEWPAPTMKGTPVDLPEPGPTLEKFKEYIEQQFGKVVDAKGTRARYVRSYTRGSHTTVLNALEEIEVYALPAP